MESEHTIDRFRTLATASLRGNSTERVLASALLHAASQIERLRRQVHQREAAVLGGHGIHMTKRVDL